MPPKKSGGKRSGQRFRKRYGAGKKFVKIHAGDKHEEKRSVTANNDRGSIPVTPQMIRLAVKELHKKRVFVSLSLIANHLKRCYPIHSDPTAFKKELEDKLTVAVSVGLVAKCGTDSYCLPTLRQDAYTQKTQFSAFWERYNNCGPRNRKNDLENTRKKFKKSLHRLKKPLRRSNHRTDKKDDELDTS